MRTHCANAPTRWFQGEKAMGFVFDCGPLNNNGALILAFLQLLVDCGMFTVAFAILLQLRHSKQLPDELFGRVAAMEKTIIGIDSLLFW